MSFFFFQIDMFPFGMFSIRNFSLSSFRVHGNTPTDVIQDESFNINFMFAARYKKLICVWYSPYLVYITPNDGHNTVTAFNIPEHISRTVPALLKLIRGSLEVEGHKRIKATKAIHNSTCEWG